ncbi:MAG TPA: LytTR family DNA-binding domain-containing protein [Burkholderiales bacterium]|nr:LytTR family DNA-binding domain-containing protein [Burkholderiales bacterium]
MSEGVLRIMIVDDEAPARARLKDLLGDCAAEVALEVVGEAATARAALDLLATIATDLLLLDIRMPEMDGIELAQHLQKLPHPPGIVFTTAYDAYAIRAFEVHAIDYLLKPIRTTRLVEALKRVKSARAPTLTALREMSQRAPAFLSAQERGRIHLIPVSEVIYLKAELKYVTVRTAEREYLIEDALARLEQEYPGHFVRVHRNCIIARAAIRGFERGNGEGETQWLALLKGCDEKIALSRRQHHLVRQFGRE